MPTTITEAKSYKDPAWTGGPPNSLIHRQSKPQTFATTASFIASGDIIKFFKLPPNAKIVDGGFFCDQLDSNGSPTLTLAMEVTDGTTTKKLLDAVTTGAAAIDVDALALAASPAATAFEQNLKNWKGFVTTNNKFYVQLRATAGPATLVAGNIQAFISYTMDVETGEATG